MSFLAHYKQNHRHCYLPSEMHLELVQQKADHRAFELEQYVCYQEYLKRVVKDMNELKRAGGDPLLPMEQQQHLLASDNGKDDIDSKFSNYFVSKHRYCLQVSSPSKARKSRKQCFYTLEYKDIYTHREVCQLLEQQGTELVKASTRILKGELRKTFAENRRSQRLSNSSTGSKIFDKKEWKKMFESFRAFAFSKKDKTEQTKEEREKATEELTDCCRNDQRSELDEVDQISSLNTMTERKRSITTSNLD